MNTKISNFARFVIPEVDLLDQYASPDDEVSIAKAMPMHLLDQARAIMRKLHRLEGERYRVYFRGPRYDLARGYCKEKDARAFAIYKR